MPPTIPLTSTLPSVCGPAVLGARASQLLTQLPFLELSPWLPTKRLREGQLRQLELLIEHAARHSAPCGYHAQSEQLLVEVFASPLIRHELGDAVEIGGPRPCGRGLPALHVIVGHAMNDQPIPASGPARAAEGGKP